MPYTDWNSPHAGSAEVLTTGMFDEPTGTLARTMPRWGLGSGNLAVLTTTGQVGVRMIPLPQGLPVTNIMVLIGGTAAVAPTHFWMGLTDVNLNILAVTADNGSGALAANTPIKMPVGVQYIVPYTGLYGIAVSSSATTTAPTLVGNAIITGVPTALGNPQLCGSAGTQVAPPAIGTQLSSGSLSGSGAINFNFGAWIS